MEWATYLIDAFVTIGHPSFRRRTLEHVHDDGDKYPDTTKVYKVYRYTLMYDMGRDDAEKCYGRQPSEV